MEVSERARAAIRHAWLGLIEENRFRRYGAKDVMRRLPAQFTYLSERAVRWHMQAIAIGEATNSALPTRQLTTAHEPIT